MVVKIRVPFWVLNIIRHLLYYLPRQPFGVSFFWLISYSWFKPLLPGLPSSCGKISYSYYAYIVLRILKVGNIFLGILDCSQTVLNISISMVDLLCAWWACVGQQAELSNKLSNNRSSNNNMGHACNGRGFDSNPLPGAENVLRNVCRHEMCFTLLQPCFAQHLFKLAFAFVSADSRADQKSVAHMHFQYRRSEKMFSACV